MCDFTGIDACLSIGAKYSRFLPKFSPMPDDKATSRPSNKRVGKPITRTRRKVTQGYKEQHVATEKATFGAGCFWGVEARFSEMPGVLDTAVGYEGGSLEHPTYKEVCTDRTGHAEVVQLIFDPSRLSYESLLDAFFALHDQTQVNR